MVYRANFFTWSAVTLGWVVFNILFLELIFGNLDTLAGWNKGQVFILQGFIFLIDLILWGVIYNNLYDFPQKITRGTMDLELVKPVDAQFILSLKQFAMNQINSLILGIAMISYGIRVGGLHPTILDFVYAFLVFLIAAFFLYSGYFASVCTAFWFDRLSNIVYLFPQLRQFSKVPLPALRGWVRVVLVYFLPAALIASLPSQFLFGERHFDLVGVLAFLAVISFLFSRWIFAQGLKKYSSASS